MKLYNITVNGKQYEVEVEEVTGGAQAPRVSAPVATAPTAPVAPVAAAPAPKKAEEPKKAAPAAVSQGAYVAKAPIPGTILDVKVSVGDTVKEGQLLLILEAMKMENEIFAAQGGTVDTVQVSKGDAVNAGDVLLSLK